MTESQSDLEVAARQPARIRSDYFDEPVNVFFSDVEHLEHLPKKPGWYCWIYVPINEDDMSPLVCRLPSLGAIVSGYLGFEYEGLIKAKSPKVDPLKPKDFDLVRSAMLAFAPPLYIGMAKDLRARLLSHGRHLRAPVAQKELLPDQLDTETESAFFGYRIAQLLSENSIRRECLIVKCVVSPTKTAQRLKRVETVLNRLYAPPHGRRA